MNILVIKVINRWIYKLHNQYPVEKKSLLWKTFDLCTRQHQFSYISDVTVCREFWYSDIFINFLCSTNLHKRHFCPLLRHFFYKIWTLHVFHPEQTLTRAKDIVVTWHYQLEPGLACDWNETRDCFLGNEYSITNYRSV